MFAFAGLWESWKDKATGERLYTYAIVTTDPNEVVAPLHNRMPVILSSKDYDRWLALVDLAQLPRRSPPTISGRHDDGMEGEQGCWQRRER